MKMFRLMIVLFTMSFYSLGALAYFPAPSQGGLGQSCYSPQQLAGLFSKSKKPNFSSKIRSLEREKKILEKEITGELSSQLEENTEELAEFLNKVKLDEDPDKVAEKIKEYMETRQDKWCEPEPTAAATPVTPAAAPIVATPAPAPIVATPAPAPIVATPAPDHLEEARRILDESQGVGADVEIVGEPGLYAPPRNNSPSDNSSSSNLPRGNYFYPSSVKEFVSFIFPQAQAEGEGKRGVGGCNINEIWNNVTKECDRKSVPSGRSACMNAGHAWVPVAGAGPGGRCVIPGKDKTGVGDCTINEIWNDVTKKCDPKNVPSGRSACRNAGHTWKPVDGVGSRWHCVKPEVAEVVPEAVVPRAVVPRVVVPRVVVPRVVVPRVVVPEVVVPEVVVPRVPAATLECPHNKPWQGTDYFGKNGKVKSKFCKKFANTNDKEECQEAIDDMRDIMDEIGENSAEIDEIKDEIKELKKQQRENRKAKRRRELGLDSDGDTEAGYADCPECAYLEKLRELNKPSTGQIIGNSLLAISGVALSVYGVKEARRSQASANELLALQGLPAENNFGHSVAGASLGLPFIQRGIYGMSQGNMSQGGYACSPSPSYHQQTPYYHQQTPYYQGQYNHYLGY